MSVLVFVLGFAACRGDQYLMAPGATDEVTLDIADAAHGYKPGFYWLPPMVLSPDYSGAFDAQLSPRVEICQLVGDACGAVIAVFTTTEGPGGEVVRLQPDEELYQVNWQTAKFALSSWQLYRVHVKVGDVILGYADIQLVDNGSGFKNIDTNEKIGLVSGRTLPIKFRVEAGILGQIEVLPGEAEAAPGNSRQFVAVARDLHGNLMNVNASWASSDNAVATVDQTGLATAMAGGVATITATALDVGGLATFRVVGGLGMVDAGNVHSCALDATGAASCWGFNTLGQLGDGTTTNRLIPVRVSGSLLFSIIEAGGNHSCAVTTAGVGYCWGFNQFGQLGDGTTLNRTVPTPIDGSTGAQRFVMLAAGGTHTCGVTPANEAFCWGDGAQGRTGLGAETAQKLPQRVSGGVAFAAITAGASHTCALTPGGQAYCWGLGFFGALGNGSVANRLTPFPVSGGLTFASVQAGTNHTCALTPDQRAYCWGSDLRGQLGDGLTGVRVSPVAVAGGLTFAVISPGSLHTCGLTPTGQAYCWGANSSGQLGDGTKTDRWTPTAVSGGLTFTSISAGTGTDSFTCGVTTTGERYCWGSGRLGTLGNGTTTLSQTTPTLVSTVQ